MPVEAFRARPWHCRARAGHGARPCRPGPAAGAGVRGPGRAGVPGDGLGAVGGAECAHQVVTCRLTVSRATTSFSAMRVFGLPAASTFSSRPVCCWTRPGTAAASGPTLACCLCRRMPAAPRPGSRAGCRGRRRGLPYGPRPAGASSALIGVPAWANARAQPCGLAAASARLGCRPARPPPAGRQLSARGVPRCGPGAGRRAGRSGRRGQTPGRRRRRAHRSPSQRTTARPTGARCPSPVRSSSR